MNLARLAHQQRRVTFLFLGLLVLQLLLGFSPLKPLLIIVFVVVLILAVRMMITLEMNTGLMVLASIGLVIPVINLIVLAAISHSASTVLRSAGLRVGPIGVDEQDIERIGEITGRCTNCWYDLTGNRSGYCPECGHRT